MRISYLEEFIDFCYDLNFTSAARRLNMSASALSTHIAALEKEAGASLVNRSARPTLTPEGQAFFDYAYKIVDLYSDALTTCREMQGRSSYTLRIDKLIRIGEIRDCFRRFIADFDEQHAHIKVLRTQCENTSILTSLLDEQVDLAIYSTTCPEVVVPRLESLGLQSILFRSDEVGAWVAKDSRLGSKEKLSVHDIKDCTFLHSNKWRARIWRMSLKHLLAQVDAVPNIKFGFHSHIADYAYDLLSDDEIMLLSTATAEQSGLLRNRDDRTLVFFDPPIYLSAYVAYSTENKNPALQVFIDSVNQEFCDCVAS